MPCSLRNPRYYLESTIWWPCPFCPKSCRSKAGRKRHIGAKHGNVALHQSQVSFNDNASQTPPQVSPPSSRNSVQPENIEIQDIDMDFATTPTPSMYVLTWNKYQRPHGIYFRRHDNEWPLRLTFVISVSDHRVRCLPYFGLEYCQFNTLSSDHERYVLAW